MKKTKKIAALVLMIALMVTGVLAGCGKANTDQNTSAQATNKAADDSLTKVMNTGTVVIGVDDEFPPMGFRDDSGNIVGFDVDFANAVAAKLGVKAEIKKINWDAKELELSTGKIDMIWNGYTITKERAKKVSFSKPYLKSNQVIIVKADSPIAKKADLAGKTVGLQNESSSEEALKKDEKTYNAIGEDHIKKYATNVEAFMDLKVGRVDAVIVDEVVARYQATKEAGYKILDENFGGEEYGVGFRKEDKELRDAVQKAMDAVIADGEATQISNKWFSSDIVEK